MSDNELDDIDELIIEMIKPHCLFYDKTVEEYHTECRGKKLEILESISQAIYQIYEKNLTESEIMKRWMSLVKKFKEEYKKTQSYCPSGSGNKNTGTWKFYDYMLWILPHIQHMPQFSSNDLEIEKSNNINSRNVKQFSRKRKENDFNKLEELLNNNAKMIKSLEQEVSADTVAVHMNNNENVNRFMRTIKAGFSLVPKEKRFTCTRKIIAYIAEFKSSIK